MIPVTFGWVKVGTQTSAGSIEKALKSVPVPVMGDETNVTGRCIGICDRTQYSTSYKSWTTTQDKSEQDDSDDDESECTT